MAPYESVGWTKLSPGISSVAHKEQKKELSRFMKKAQLVLNFIST